MAEDDKKHECINFARVKVSCGSSKSVLSLMGQLRNSLLPFQAFCIPKIKTLQKYLLQEVK